MAFLNAFLWGAGITSGIMAAILLFALIFALIGGKK